jgi:hypothetical protein
LEATRNILDVAKSDLKEEVSKFLQHVDIYKNAVISMGQLDLLEKLGILQEFNSVNQPLEESYKDSIIIRANDEVFSEFGIYDSEFRQKSNEILEKIKANLNKITKIKKRSTSIGADKKRRIRLSEISSVTSIAINSLELRAKRILEMELLNFQDENREIHNQRQNLIKKNIRNIVLKFIATPLLITILVGVVSVTIFELDKLAVSENFSGFVVGVLVLLVSFVIQGLYKIHKEKIQKPEHISDTRKKSEDAYADCVRKIDESFSKLRIDFSSIEEELESQLMPYFAPNKSTKEIEPLVDDYDAVYRISSSTHAAELKYRETMVSYFEKVEKLLLETDRHKKNLKNMSEEIKSDAITPSFNQLENLKLNLEQVKTKVAGIRFV